VDKRPKLVFAAIVLIGLPFAVWAGWTWAGTGPAPAATPAGDGGLGTAPVGGKQPRVRMTPLPSSTVTPTATPTASTSPTQIPASPTATGAPTLAPSPSETLAPEATVEPPPPPTEPPASPDVSPTP
jgi:hypothetical protein